MATDTTLTPRQRLLLSLADDLNVQGWDQPSKIWSLNGESGDEWIAFLSDITGKPEDYLLGMIESDQKPDGHGLLVATEGWDYPVEVSAQLADAKARRALWRSTPPDQHPQRVEIRHLLLVCQDGEVLGLTVSHETVPSIRWARMDSNMPSPTGNRVIDGCRAVLGLNKDLVKRVEEFGQLKSLLEITKTLEKAMSGDYSEDELTRELFLSLPDSMKSQVVADMPEEVKDVVRGVLSEEERRRYGL